MSSETKVTEFGSNPAGTDACAGSGVGDGDALGDGEASGLGVVVTTSDGDGLGLRDGVPAADEHAASSRTLPALPARRRVIRHRSCHQCEKRAVGLGSYDNGWRCAEPVTVPAPSTDDARLDAGCC